MFPSLKNTIIPLVLLVVFALDQVNALAVTFPSKQVKVREENIDSAPIAARDLPVIEDQAAKRGEVVEAREPIFNLDATLIKGAHGHWSPRIGNRK
ncbi:hypothetical protein CC2G_002619 [Coprinopsis cinerea AmutBmut pab1-1]|nr:hypothetical protein CC2G_002619 [Coprinopsis cinerea AmutBmut pab1-1]